MVLPPCPEVFESDPFPGVPVPALACAPVATGALAYPLMTIGTVEELMSEGLLLLPALLLRALLLELEELEELLELEVLPDVEELPPPPLVDDVDCEVLDEDVELLPEVDELLELLVSGRFTNIAKNIVFEFICLIVD